MRTPASHGMHPIRRGFRLLSLWDELGIPHQQPKQVYGRSLTIIGMHIDSDAMTITLPRESADKLVQHVRSFVQDAP